MKLELILLFFFLFALIIPAQLSKHDKHQHHGKKDSNEKHGEKHHNHKPQERRGRVQALMEDYDDFDDGHDDEDEERGQWLFQLQTVRGSCNPNPCLNNGVCEEEKRKFKCKCPKPFTGRRCEQRKRVCRRDTCGYGQCVLTSTPPYYECKCKAPFKPPNCKNVAPCEPSPCLNGGSCIKDGEDFFCACIKGFTGKSCRVESNDCYEGDGEAYRGKVSETEEGHDCLFWNSHFLLNKGINPFTKFEDTEGLGPHNFCRNPDGETKPWCFIRLGKKIKWDHCNVRKCATDKGTTSTSPPTAKPTIVIVPDIKPTPIIQHPVTQLVSSHPLPESHPTESFQPTVSLLENNTGTLISVSQAPEVTNFPSHLPVTSLPELLDPESQGVSEFKTCGKPQPKKSLNRIYGGLKAVPGAHPWQASIQVKPKGTTLSFKHICGGVLIKPCWVLTAGHCIDNTKDYQVLLGGIDLKKHEEAKQELEVVEAIRHEQYKETKSAVYNDLGLLRLKAKNGKCAEESQFVKTACLPTEDFPDGTECNISGWGATENSFHGTTQLLDAEVLLISQDVCSSDKVYGKVIENSMFCAGHLQGGVDSCQGDSGGPLTCRKNQTQYVYGIVSWGDNCGEKNKPGVYSRITHFLDWINTKTASMAPK